ncbi:MAG TPA: hypothetical protein VKQ71_03685 [Acidimicrobiales bacterium]|nr:hypothetical protein [Acidimicrobiales bacterium]
MTVTMGDELYQRVHDELPGLNVSALLQEALRARLKCSHDGLECRGCGARFGSTELVVGGMQRFYGEALNALDDLVYGAGGTAEGAARVLRRVAERFGLEVSRPLPRPTRAQRGTGRDRRWLTT